MSVSISWVLATFLLTNFDKFQSAIPLFSALTMSLVKQKTRLRMSKAVILNGGVLRRYDIIYLLMKLMKESIFRGEGGVLKKFVELGAVRSKRLRSTGLKDLSAIRGNSHASLRNLT